MNYCLYIYSFCKKGQFFVVNNFDLHVHMYIYAVETIYLKLIQFKQNKFPVGKNILLQ
jgi:hypothetical protein